MTDLVLRSGHTGDAAALAAIEAEATEFPWSVSAYRDSIKNHHCRILESGGAPLACLVYSRVLDEVELLNIVVDPQCQGQGLGRRLIDLLIDENRDRAVKIFLEVRESNTPAIGLYGKKGFVLLDTRKNYYPAGNGREDALIMVYRYDG